MNRCKFVKIFIAECVVPLLLVIRKISLWYVFDLDIVQLIPVKWHQLHLNLLTATSKTISYFYSIAESNNNSLVGVFWLVFSSVNDVNPSLL